MPTSIKDSDLLFREDSAPEEKGMKKESIQLPHKASEPSVPGYAEIKGLTWDGIFRMTGTL